MSNINDIKKLDTFKFWCQKTMPLVYDDSLSYYELLCKVVDYLNKIINDMQIIVESDKELQTAFTTLKNYVDNYFNNLNVEDEINNKLDEMFANGEFDVITDRLLQSTPVLNVKLIGIDTNKTPQENHNTLQQYLNTNTNTSYTLYFPSGIYQFNDYIKIPSNVNIMGDGSTSVLSNITSEKGILIISGNNVRIENVRIYDTTDTALYTEEYLKNDNIIAGIIINDKNFENDLTEIRNNVQINNVTSNFKLDIVVDITEQSIENLFINKLLNEDGFIQVRKGQNARLNCMHISSSKICGIYCDTIKENNTTTITDTDLKYIDYGLYPLNISNCIIKSFNSTENNSKRFFDKTVNTSIIKEGVVSCCNSTINNVTIDISNLFECGFLSLMDTDYYDVRQSILLINNCRFIGYKLPYKTRNHLGFRTTVSMLNAFTQDERREKPMEIKYFNGVEKSGIQGDLRTNMVRRIDANTFSISIDVKLKESLGYDENTKILDIGNVTSMAGALFPYNFINGYFNCNIEYITSNGTRVTRCGLIRLSGGTVSVVAIHEDWSLLPNISDLSSTYKYVNITANGMVYNYAEIRD